MALPPLPGKNTQRYFIDYTSMGITHTVLFRTNAVAPAPEAYFSDIIDAMAQCMRVSDSITQIRSAVKGSDVTFPVGAPAVPGALSNASTISDDPESVFVSVPFRGNPDGRKGRYDFYFPTNIIPLDSNNRLTFSEVSQLELLYTQINELATTGGSGVYLCTISESALLMNTYWNRAKNAYWQRRQRL